MKRRLLLAALPAALAACSALPQKPTTRPTLYDFGPVPTGSAAAATRLAPLVLPEIEAQGILETSALLYRLGYEDPFQLRPYAYARWSAPPAQLVRQRLRDVLGRDRAVLDTAAAAALAQRGGERPPVLRVEVEDFSQMFDSTSDSRGMVRLRCTLLQASPGGERLVAQRIFAAERPAPSADAAGGVRALTAAVDAAAADIGAWLQQR